MCFRRKVHSQAKNSLGQCQASQDDSSLLGPDHPLPQMQSGMKRFVFFLIQLASRIFFGSDNDYLSHQSVLQKFAYWAAAERETP